MYISFEKHIFFLEGGGGLFFVSRNNASVSAYYIIMKVPEQYEFFFCPSGKSGVPSR